MSTETAAKRRSVRKILETHNLQDRFLNDFEGSFMQDNVWVIPKLGKRVPVTPTEWGDIQAKLPF